MSQATLATVRDKLTCDPARFARRLATPDEIMRMNADDLLLLRQGQHPLVVGKIRYYAEREFAGLYDPV